MKKIIVFVLLICITPSIFSQEKVLELSGNFSKKTFTDKESYAFPDQTNQNLLVLTTEGKVTTAILLDASYKQQSKLLAQPLDSKYSNLIGYGIEDEIYSIFYSNNKNTKFAVMQFDFTNEKTAQKILDFKLKKERFIEVITYKNKIYLFSITKRSSDLNIYTFNKEFNSEKHTISLQQLEYASNTKQGYTRKAYDMFFVSAKIAKIESGNPNVIETTSKKIKLYQANNEVILSFDNSNKETKLCYINLDNYTLKYKAYPKPAATEGGFFESNSYIFDTKLFQIASSSQKMKFTILDLETEKTIKEYVITKKDTITFKNSPIIQEGAYGFWGYSEDKIREMEKTSKYLRKISNANLGISVYKVNGEYNIVLGGTKEMASGGGAPAFGPGFGGGFGVGGTVGGFGTVTMSFNPTFYGYNNYSSTKSTYINCLFDENFEHLEGDIQKNVFDKVNEFEDSLEEEPKAVNIFLHNDILHYGYYDKLDAVYKLYTFDK